MKDKLLEKFCEDHVNFAKTHKNADLIVFHEGYSHAKDGMVTNSVMMSS